MSGWATVPLGQMYNPVFSIGTAYAIHGDTYVPLSPSRTAACGSDGHCRLLPHSVKAPGTRVYIYG